MKRLFAAASLALLAFRISAQDATITIHADQVQHPISRYLTGACIEDVNHEIYGGLYSQMIFGESFQESPKEQPGLSGMWRAVHRGEVQGVYALETNDCFVGSQSQRITYTRGNGEIGIANSSLNHWGMYFIKGRHYEGSLDARAEMPVKLAVRLESVDGSKVYSELILSIKSHEWERLGFGLTPSANDTNGRFVISLKHPGSVVLGYASLQPGHWGHFDRLPVRGDVAKGLIDQAVTVLRYGGSMVNANGYRWKHMIGPRDRRPPYRGTWYRYSTDGWGIIDFLNFCEAAGFLGIPDLNINESPEDIADFVEYVNGPTNTRWGARRAADGHPKPYQLKYMELGNEERVDENYYRKFKALAEAIWAKDTDIIPVVGDFSYHDAITDPFHITGADSRITSLAAQKKILQLAKEHDREVAFDVHVWTEGPETHFAEAQNFYDALERIADGANFHVMVFELNANNHSQRRAIANAQSILMAMNDGRFPIVTSANGLQPDGQNNNGWDQGLLFLNPSQVWLQPPGYVTQMISRNYQPLAIKAEATGAPNLRICATRDEGGKAVVLFVVNPAEHAAAASIKIDGFSLRKNAAEVEELSGDLNASNTAAHPAEITPKQSQWQHHLEGVAATYEFKPYSVTVMRFE